MRNIFANRADNVECFQLKKNCYTFFYRPLYFVKDKHEINYLAGYSAQMIEPVDQTYNEETDRRDDTDDVRDGICLFNLQFKIS